LLVDCAILQRCVVWVWQIGVFAFALLLGCGTWLLIKTGTAAGLAIAAIGAVGLVSMWARHGRATRHAVATLIEALVAYVSGAWFWHRER
jgi:hypothetical protein